MRPGFLLAQERSEEILLGARGRRDRLNALEYGRLRLYMADIANTPIDDASITIANWDSSYTNRTGPQHWPAGTHMPAACVCPWCQPAPDTTLHVHESAANIAKRGHVGLAIWAPAPGTYTGITTGDGQIINFGRPITITDPHASVIVVIHE